MTPTRRRLAAAAVATTVALLTGLIVGLVSPQATCWPVAAPPLPGGASAVAGGEAGGRQPVAGSRADVKVTCSVGRFEVVPAVVGAAGGLAGCAAMFVLLLGGGRRRGAAGAAGAAQAAARPGRGGAEQRTTVLAPAGAEQRTTVPARAAEADRAALIQACIYVCDRTTSPALADRLGSALGEAGVRAVEPAGARFDPAHHEAGGSAPSGDPAKVGTVAAVEVPGYADRDGRLLRVPVVTVYRPATRADREAR
jgi:hypothetical protein